MRSFARVLPALLILIVPMPLHAQSAANARQVYNEALKREAELRRDMDAHGASDPVAPLLQRIRTLVGAYTDMARLFQSDEQSDNALWQGAMLSADTFWRFGDEIDRAAALNLLDALTTRFPTSARTAQAPPHVRRLSEAPVLTPVPGFGDERPPAVAAIPPPPIVDSAAAGPALPEPTAVASAEAPVQPAGPLPVPPLPEPAAPAPAAAPASASPQTAAARPAPAAAPLEPGASSTPRSPTPFRETPVSSVPLAPGTAADESAGAVPMPAAQAAAPLPVPAPAQTPPAVPTPPPAPPTASPAPAVMPRELTPVPTPAPVPVPAGPARLTGIHGEALGDDAIRFILALEREVQVRHEQFGGPPRVVIDLQDTIPAETLTQALLPHGADVVSRIRVGRHDGSWTRVVIELRAPSRYGVFVLQDPYRVLIEVHPRLAQLSTDASVGSGTGGR